MPPRSSACKQNDIPIYEPGLEEMVRRNQAEGRLTFTTDVGAAVEQSTVVFIAVGTPPGEDGSADLQHVLAVARTIGRHLNGPKVIVTKSTVPVGTAERVRAAIRAETGGSFFVCSNPEFLKEGAAIEDFMKPDRIIVGVDSDEAREIMAELYEPFVRTGNPMLFMDIPSAEVTKYAANAMLATRISFMNQIAKLCERVGADVNSVRKGIGADRRIGPAFLFPGPGYGGSCFPKDVKALIRTGGEVGLQFDVLEAVDRVNERQKHVLLREAARQPPGRPGRPDRRRLGARLQGRDRRHAREPRDPAGRGAARGGRPGPGPRPEGDGDGPRHLRRPGHVRRRSLQRGRRAPTRSRS